MIGQLEGKLKSKKPTRLLIDVNGVGYIVYISINTFEKLGEEGSHCSIYTYLSVKDDALDLYGFYSESEKEMFQLLISVSGIGPKLALSILSGIQIEDLKDSIREGNVTRITAIPGIGRKTAERLVVELRDKADNVADSAEIKDAGTYSIKKDAISALVSLGYNHKIAEQAVRKILEAAPNSTVEDLIKEALSNFSK
jgi:Holliday junction DNA helicase RuvA